MEILFDTNLSCKPLISIILLDWCCRESFHSLDYLSDQTIPREQYEIIWIEYYNRRSPEIEAALKKCEKLGKPPVVDKWIVMGMPDTIYYHKHLMYNLGIVVSKGGIITFCDSDAIFSPTFIESIIKAFEEDRNIVLHIDEVRNVAKKFYPFCYPDIKDLLDETCSNWKNGKTTGLWDEEDLLHSRNYGACMAARRNDLIEIGGADEHADYLGHVCGPYDMTFRLRNFGWKEIWHQKEFLYHTWHPGESGDLNFVGPHDGKLLSSTALKVLRSGNILPLVQNQVIKVLRLGYDLNEDTLNKKLIDPAYIERFSFDELVKEGKLQVWYKHEYIGSYKDFNIIGYRGKIYGVPKFLLNIDLGKEEDEHPIIITADSIENVKKKIDKFDTKYLVPEPIEKYNDFTILRFGNRFYAISNALGKFNIFDVELRRSLVSCLSAQDIKTVKVLVDTKEHPNYYPVLTDSYRNYNLIKYVNKVFAVPQSLGKVEFSFPMEGIPPEVLSAHTQEDVKTLIDQHLTRLKFDLEQHCDGKLPQKAFLVERESVVAGLPFDPLANCTDFLYACKGYNVIRYNNKYYAAPQSIGAVDFSDEKQISHPEIICSVDRKELDRRIEKLAVATTIEYAGWLASFKKFGNCGCHPQFMHVDLPPDGYRFTFSLPREDFLKDEGNFKKRLRKRITLWVRKTQIIIAVFKFIVSALSKGARISPIIEFLKSRDKDVQLLLKRKQNLVFLPSVPYTLNQHPWLIEIEDSISMFFPFFHNGNTVSADFHNSPYFPVFKTLFESKQCRGIITHVKSTATSLPKLFKN
mgnify:FL=1